MTAFFIALSVQIVLGALDNLLHHELTEKLTTRSSARRELALHSARELIYAFIFLALAWTTPYGAWAWALAVLALIELIITLADFIEEDKTRTLPPFERVLHTILAINLGIMTALIAPTWQDWATSPTALLLTEHGLFSWVLTFCALGVGAWGIRDALAARALLVRPPPLVPWSGRTLVITGATGFLGKALTRRRLAAGDRIIIESRDPKQAHALFAGRVLAVRDVRQLPESLGIDAVINLAGAGVANALWTPARKRALLNTRIDAALRVNDLLQRLTHKPGVLINASAVGYYGDRGEHILDENAAPGAGFPSRLCEQWETLARSAGDHAQRLVILRFGLVLGCDGGAWPRLALTLPYGLGVRLGSGRQWMPWTHKQDALRAIEFALDNPRLSGVANVVAPNPARHGDVLSAAAAAHGGASLLPMPAWTLRLLVGQMACLFLDSQRVTPAVLTEAGFAFDYPDIASATGALAAREAPARANAPTRTAA